jgi:hypothetical protein
MKWLIADDKKKYPDTAEGAKSLLKHWFDPEAFKGKMWAIPDPSVPGVWMVFHKHGDDKFGQEGDLKGWDVHITYNDKDDFETVENTRESIEKYAPYEVRELVESKLTEGEEKIKKWFDEFRKNIDVDAICEEIWDDEKQETNFLTINEEYVKDMFNEELEFEKVDKQGDLLRAVKENESFFDKQVKDFADWLLKTVKSALGEVKTEKESGFEDIGIVPGFKPGTEER